MAEERDMSGNLTLSADEHERWMSGDPPRVGLPPPREAETWDDIMRTREERRRHMRAWMRADENIRSLFYDTDAEISEDTEDEAEGVEESKAGAEEPAAIPPGDRGSRSNLERVWDDGTAGGRMLTLYIPASRDVQKLLRRNMKKLMLYRIEYIDVFDTSTIDQLVGALADGNMIVWRSVIQSLPGVIKEHLYQILEDGYFDPSANKENRRVRKRKREPSSTTYPAKFMR